MRIGFLGIALLSFFFSFSVVAENQADAHDIDGGTYKTNHLDVSGFVLSNGGSASSGLEDSSIHHDKKRNNKNDDVEQKNNKGNNSSSLRGTLQESYLTENKTLPKNDKSKRNHHAISVGVDSEMVPNITKLSEMEFNLFQSSMSDPTLDQQQPSGRRRLVPSSHGSYTLLVVRVRSRDCDQFVVDWGVPENEGVKKLSDIHFGSHNGTYWPVLSLTDQYDQCSGGKTTFTPATGPGVVDGVLDYFFDGTFGPPPHSSEAVVGQVHQKFTEETRELGMQYDFLEYELPTCIEGSGGIAWRGTSQPAVSYLINWGIMHAQPHEIGHNFGLDHSGEFIDGFYNAYADPTCMMGMVVAFKNACFNAAKSYYMGWYSEPGKEGHDDVFPFDTVGQFWKRDLVGIDDYVNGRFDQSTDRVIARFDDIFVMYNRAKGVNKDVQGYKDQVIIVQQSGGMWAYSTVLTALDETKRTFIIPNYRKEGLNLVINVCEIDLGFEWRKLTPSGSASQASTYAAGRIANFALDGDESTSTHTLGGDSEWWEWTLDQPVDAEKIVVRGANGWGHENGMLDYSYVEIFNEAGERLLKGNLGKYESISSSIIFDQVYSVSRVKIVTPQSHLLLSEVGLYEKQPKDRDYARVIAYTTDTGGVGYGFGGNSGITCDSQMGIPDGVKLLRYTEPCTQESGSNTFKCSVEPTAENDEPGNSISLYAPKNKEWGCTIVVKPIHWALEGKYFVFQSTESLNSINECFVPGVPLDLNINKQPNEGKFLLPSQSKLIRTPAPCELLPETDNAPEMFRCSIFSDNIGWHDMLDSPTMEIYGEDCAIQLRPVRWAGSGGNFYFISSEDLGDINDCFSPGTHLSRFPPLQMMPNGLNIIRSSEDCVFEREHLDWASGSGGYPARFYCPIEDIQEIMEPNNYGGPMMPIYGTNCKIDLHPVHWSKGGNRLYFTSEESLESINGCFSVGTQLSAHHVSTQSTSKSVATLLDLDGAKASQSSWYNGNHHPYLAIDGNKYSPPAVTHTKYEDYPWWELSLKSSAIIDSVVVYNRNEFMDRLDNAIITLLDNKGTIIVSKSLGTDVTVETVEFDCSHAVFGIRIQLPSEGFLSLEEVEVYGEYLVAGAKLDISDAAVTQSSTYHGYPAFHALDGIDDSFSHTETEDYPWWEASLENSIIVDYLVIHNRKDCCRERLNDAIITLWNDQGIMLAAKSLGTDVDVEAVPFGSVPSVAAIKIQLPHVGAILSLAEVEVFGYAESPRIDIADAIATQSTTYGWFSAGNAVDGSKSSFTHTENEDNPWWKLSLNKLVMVDYVVISNRLDCCRERLDNAVVTLLGSGGEQLASKSLGTDLSVETLYFGSVESVAMVKIQLKGQGILSLAQVEIHGLDPNDSPTPTLTPSTQSTWKLVAHMGIHDNYGLFDGNTNYFDQTTEYKSELAVPYDQLQAGTHDFLTRFPFTPKKIKFETGNRKFIAIFDWAQFSAVVNGKAGQFGSNIDYDYSDDSGLSFTRKQGNILSRAGVAEDPWIDLSPHHCQDSCSTIIWGENNFGDGLSSHAYFKNKNGGINVLIQAENNGGEVAPGTGADPHFTTWQQEHYEYHGQCDLVLIKDEKFAENQGLDIHIRTSLVRYWSYIKAVAIRIGNDILEIEGSADAADGEAHYWINYEPQGELNTFAGFPV